jgi:hypothetical protein
MLDRSKAGPGGIDQVRCCLKHTRLKVLCREYGLVSLWERFLITPYSAIQQRLPTKMLCDYLGLPSVVHARLPAGEVISTVHRPSAISKSHLTAKEIQAEPKKDEVVDYVYENRVDRRTGRSAYVSSSDPEDECVRKRRREQVHRRKQRSLDE